MENRTKNYWLTRPGTGVEAFRCRISIARPAARAETETVSARPRNHLPVGRPLKNTNSNSPCLHRTTAHCPVGRAVAVTPPRGRWYKIVHQLLEYILVDFVPKSFPTVKYVVNGKVMFPRV